MIQLIDFLFSIFIWFSPWADADQPFGEMGFIGTTRFYMPHLYVYALGAVIGTIWVKEVQYESGNPMVLSADRRECFGRSGVSSLC